MRRIMENMVTDDRGELSPQIYAEFERMRERTERRAYSMALQLTRNASDAQDLLQETYVKAWKGFNSYMPGRPFLNWLLRIMQRAYLDDRRRDNPIRKADSLNSMVSPSDGEVQEIPIPDDALQADEELMMEEFSAELKSALSELPTVYREAIYYCDIKEMSYQDIADLQGTTVGTVRSRIHRGRKLLRDVVIRKGIVRPSIRRVG
ncbi:RNA polymerase subunit sigma-70 [bacterium]|nr:RNA polymerase subunit sigma-70 [bacterium]